jgi:hypothetical protein
MPQALTNAAAKFVDSLKISLVFEKIRRDRRVVVRRRNAHSEQLADLANLYFRMSSISRIDPMLAPGFHPTVRP